MWRPVCSKPGPGCLHSHLAVKFLNDMILFGGDLEYGLCKDHFTVFSFTHVAAGAQQAGALAASTHNPRSSSSMP
jgi:hypothetical protein